VIVTHELSQNRGRKRSSDTPENPYTAGELRDLPITYVRTSGFREVGYENVTRCKLRESSHSELRNLEIRDGSLLVAEIVK